MPLAPEKQRNQQSSEPSIAIEKGMNCFELHMYKSSRNENRKFVFFVVKEVFEAVETFHHSFWWGRHECSITGSAATNLIL